ncbi:MAG: hypothetical protein K5682_00550 [Lachnospiraceae bacterium]|nr:hypothetical protein [Lachnospiraceae bacterium]
MTEQEAIELAKRFYNEPNLYILLAPEAANMATGISIPAIGVMKGELRLIFLFTSKEIAQEYVDSKEMDKPDGIYPIAALKRGHELFGLHAICNGALAIHVDGICFNDGQAESLALPIPVFLQINGLKPEPYKMLMAKEQAQALKDNGEKPRAHMNPMAICDFTNPYRITDERKEELMNLLMADKPEDSLKSSLTDSCRLWENCYQFATLQMKYIQKAQRDFDAKNLDLYGRLAGLLQEIILDKLVSMDLLFTLRDDETGMFYIKNHACYLLYTDRYKYAAPQSYVPLYNLEGFAGFLKRNQVDRVIVTDGPHDIALLSASSVIKKILN